MRLRVMLALCPPTATDLLHQGNGRTGHQRTHALQLSPYRLLTFETRFTLMTRLRQFRKGCGLYGPITTFRREARASPKLFATNRNSAARPRAASVSKAHRRKAV
jgi:hypothetical protein